jgi:hypothetical protein
MKFKIGDLVKVKPSTTRPRGHGVPNKIGYIVDISSSLSGVLYHIQLFDFGQLFYLYGPEIELA